MRADRFDYTGKFNLLIIFWLSLSLTIPLIQGLGYIVPGFVGNLFFTALAIAVYTVVHLFPLLALAVPVVLLAVVALNFLYYPYLLTDIYAMLTETQPNDSLIWPLVIIAAATLIFYLLLFKLKKPLLPLLLIGLISFVPLWYLFVNTAYPTAISYAVCWLVLLSYKQGHQFWMEPAARDSDRDHLTSLRHTWITYTFIVLAIALVISLILPKNFAPVPWISAQNWVRITFPFLDELRGVEDPDVRGDGGVFGFHFSSPQGSRRLGGPLWQDELVLIEVRDRGGFYLRGTVYDTYTGSAWLNTRDSETMEDFTIPPEALLEHLIETSFRVKHRRISTNTVFHMLYPLEFSGLPWEVHIDYNTNITLPRSLSRHQEYRVKGFVIHPRTDILALEVDGKEPLVDDIYLQLPADLPSRIVELALEITEGQDGYYRKIRALERYLRTNYTYNTSIPRLPSNVDFVETFLFELGEGYCTSFASALTVMARAVGVPSRYVVGFAVPRRPAETGIYEVTGFNAHSWVESYIPGVGWLAFEPTPGFTTSETISLPVEPGDDTAEPIDQDGETTPPFNDDERAEFDNDYPSPFFPDRNDQITIPYLNYLARGMGVILLLTALAFVLVLTYRYLQIRKNIRQLEKQKTGIQAVNYYNLSLLLMDRLAIGKYPGETPREYSQRIIHEILYTRDLDFKQISEGINLALYSRNPEENPSLNKQTRLFYHYIFNRYLFEVGKLTAFMEILIQRKYFSIIRLST